ncbi:MAG: hypothetical protein ACMX3H_12020 [Sodalis sp. (in: enterobacteria)]|uniref:hypothetical protein n=1 Tax=Sodalis sp. (in: enterobacteria) TaxID=1898979 RepID=UPI0039E57C2E
MVQPSRRLPRLRQGTASGAGNRLPALRTKLKYQGDTGLARGLARLLWLRWRDRAAEGDEKPDLLLNVPLHAYRHWRRGYNQTELLATALARWLKVPWQAQVSVRPAPY